MVTYSELFQFCILIVAIINLIVMIFFNQKKNPPLPKTGYFLKLTLANRLHGIAFCIFIIPLRNFFVNDLKIFAGYH